MSSLNFNATEVAPSTGFAPLPAGDFKVVILESAIKPTSKQTGTFLELELQVIEGQYANRKLWQRITYTNPSEKAQSIGRAQLSALCRAVGVMTPQDTSELHNRPFVVTVGHEARKDKEGKPTGEMQNVIKKFHFPANVAGAVVAGSSKPAPAASAPPWAAK
jgi:hypothetical protein